MVDPSTPDRDQDPPLDRDRDHSLDRDRDQRTRLRLRHAQRLTSLMDERGDLRGVHALADHFDDAVRWSA